MKWKIENIERKKATILEFYIQPNVSFNRFILQKWKRNKDFLRQIKTKESIATRPDLQEMLQEILQAEEKWYMSETWST